MCGVCLWWVVVRFLNMGLMGSGVVRVWRFLCLVMCCVCGCWCLVLLILLLCWCGRVCFLVIGLLFVMFVWYLLC